MLFINRVKITISNIIVKNRYNISYTISIILKLKVDNVKDIKKLNKFSKDIEKL